MQELGEEIYLFVATLHGFTDSEPAEIKPNVINIVGDYIAAGVDPEKVVIFDQYDLRTEVSLVANYLNREVTASRLLRLPTLKEKVRGDNVELASAALLMYPTLMAADILYQDATHVPVGRDQKPHIEITREIARSFNKKYGDVLIVPKDYDEDDEPVNILSLRGDGKMSKSNPKGAIFLYDSADDIRSKVKSAETGIQGEKSEKVESMINIIAGILGQEHASTLQDLYDKHQAGDPVMGRFKKDFADMVISFTEPFQKRRAEITDGFVEMILERGFGKAYNNAVSVTERMEEGMGLS